MPSGAKYSGRSMVSSHVLVKTGSPLGYVALLFVFLETNSKSISSARSPSYPYVKNELTSPSGYWFDLTLASNR